ncbi:MAG: CHAT domain-containing protein [Bacteroidetes bacterium]|nr:CHAT domain-containing protein [Bacteroidota bacterium]
MQNNNTETDSAVIFLRDTAERFLQQSEYTRYTAAQIQIAREYLKRIKRERALQILTATLDTLLQHKALHNDEEGNLYALLGYVYTGTHNKEKAEQYIRKSLALNDSLYGKTDRYCLSLFSLATFYWQTDNMNEAVAAFSQTDSLYTVLHGEYFISRAKTQYQLAVIAKDRAEFVKALQYVDCGIDILDKNDDTLSLDRSSLLFIQGQIFKELGRYHEAVTLLEQSNEIQKRVNRLESMNALILIGDIKIELGDIEAAKNYYEHALAVQQTLANTSSGFIGSVLQRLGDAHRRLGNLDTALELSQEGMKILTQFYGPRHSEMGYKYFLLAQLYEQKHRYAEALENYDNAAAVYTTIGAKDSRIDLSLVFTLKAKVYLQQMNYHSALACLESADSIQRSAKTITIPARALTLRCFGDVELQCGKIETALQYYNEAMKFLCGNEVNEHTINDAVPVDPLYTKQMLDVVLRIASAYSRIPGGKKKELSLNNSLCYYRAAMNLVETLRRSYLDEESKLFLSDVSAQLYHRAAAAAFQIYEITKLPSFLEQAFLIADRGKANVLLEGILDGTAKVFAEIPDSLLRRERALQKELAEYEIQRTTMHHVPEKVRIAAELTIFRLKDQLRDIKEYYRQHYPKYYEIKFARKNFTREEMTAHLSPNEALIEYSVDNNTLIIFAATQTSLIGKKITADSLEQSITRFLYGIKTYSPDDYTQCGMNLYSLLLQPVNSVLQKVQKLTIVPDGALYYVPFEALLTAQPNSTNDFSSYPYVLLNHEISYTYSAGFLHTMSSLSKEKSMPISFAVFAPVFPDTTSMPIFAHRSYLEENNLSETRSVTVDGKHFNALTYSEDEIAGIAKVFNQKKISGREFLFSNATEENFKHAVPRASIIHIATHSFINEKNPKLSAIIFSEPQHAAVDDDGILYADEIYSLNLHAKLVVLSSCESGIGKLVGGEGMMAFTRGLFYAGAQNIIFSLWKIPDKHTATMMIKFYQEMLAGNSYAASLRSAKLSLVKEKASAFPSKWSGFVLMEGGKEINKNFTSTQPLQKSFTVPRQTFQLFESCE